MRKIIYICDLCLELGEERRARHRYTANDGKDYDICSDCLKTVKEVGLYYWRIGE